jgi:hypothetical protein
MQISDRGSRMGTRFQITPAKLFKKKQGSSLSRHMPIHPRNVTDDFDVRLRLPREEDEKNKHGHDHESKTSVCFDQIESFFFPVDFPFV